MSLSSIKRTKLRPWRRKTLRHMVLKVTAQEAYFRGYAQGNADSKFEEASSEKMINSYKAFRKSIFACVRETIKRIK